MKTEHGFRSNRVFVMLAVSAILLATTTTGQANDAKTEQKDNSAPAVPLKIKRVFTLDGRENNQVEAGIGNRIRVQVEGLLDAVAGESPGNDKNTDNKSGKDKSNTDKSDKTKLNKDKIVLYLDGLELKGLYATPIDIPAGILEYKLERTEKSKKAWDTLLGSAKTLAREVTVSVGPEDSEGIAAADGAAAPTMKLRIFHKWRLYSFTVGLILVIIGFWRLAGRTTILRESNPPLPPKGQLKPYSLGRVQMAVWFFLVVGSFIYIYLVTGDYNTITDQALILIGIGTGTALGSAAIASTKSTNANKDLADLEPERERLNAEVQQLASERAALVATANRTPVEESRLAELEVDVAGKKSELVGLEKRIADIKSLAEKDISGGVLADLLNDANGPSFHRFQMVTWTVVLVVLFIIAVYNTLAMPEFSTTLLALMGISSGTFLGFKIPERQS